MIIATASSLCLFLCLSLVLSLFLCCSPYLSVSLFLCLSVKDNWELACMSAVAFNLTGAWERGLLRWKL